MATPPATSQPIRLLYNLVVAANSLIVSDLLDNPLHFLRRGLSVRLYPNWNHSNRQIMIPRIKKIQPIDNFILLVEFDGGERVAYDVKDDIESLADFHVLETEHGLFQNAQLDSSRTCVYWTERVDLPSDTILEYGQPA